MSYDIGYCIDFSSKDWDKVGELHSALVDLVFKEGYTIVDRFGGQFIGSPLRDIGVSTLEEPSEDIVKKSTALVESYFRIATTEEIDAQI